MNIDSAIKINYSQKIIELKKQKNAVILAHYYQRPEIQDIADFVGDSLALAKNAAATSADIIVFAGVHFMAETAIILNPSKKVLIPDLNAGCSLADSCAPEDFRQFRLNHPNHVAITYINCSAEVKAQSDIICTSSNAKQIVESIDKNQPILFAPDKNLGKYLMKETGRKMVLWEGACLVHEAFSFHKVLQLCAEHPNAKIVVHPESESQILDIAHFIGSTAAIIQYIKKSEAQSFIVGTEAGILHQLKRVCVDKEIIPM
ncbi:MAG: quinolinate synthase NadA, partial [Bacteroidota bacterium]